MGDVATKTPKNPKNPKGAGRKPGVRTEAYNLALQEYLNGEGSVAEISKKYGIDRSGLNKVINSTNKEAESMLGTNDLRGVALESKNAVINGLKNIEALKNSTNPTHNALAENIIDKIKSTNLTLARNIQVIGGSLLQDLARVIAELRAHDKMDLKHINEALVNLDIANRIVGIPKSPNTMINIQNNQNNQTNISTSDKDSHAGIKFEIEFVSKKDDDVIDVAISDDKQTSNS